MLMMKKAVLIAAMMIIAGTSCRAYELYFGDIHSHTSFSDGMGTPAEAFDMARNDAGLDFWAVTDHAEQIGLVKGQPAGSPQIKEWDVAFDTAREKTENGKFIAFVGSEWGSDGQQGHMNVLNLDKYPVLEKTLRLKQFYKWVYANPGALIGFNHPYEGTEDGLIFDQMKYVPQVASQTFYIALNRPEDFKYYYMAIDNGWRVGPVAEQDNHDKDWGTAVSGHLMAVYSNELTYSGLIDAFRNRRFYATDDRNLKLWFAGNGEPMGSIVTGENIGLTIDVAHAKGAQISSVRLVTNGGAVVKEWTPGADKFHADFTPPTGAAGTQWYVVVAEEPNGKHSVSAPIWIKRTADNAK
jgi:hypothetical protein